MKVEKAEINVFVLVFEPQELGSLKDEAKDNNLTIEQMIEELFDMVFSGGYRFVTGKET